MTATRGDPGAVPSGKLFSLEGRKALVTGACGPIGRAICRGLADFGAAVAAVDHPSQDIASVVAQLEAFGSKVTSCVADFRDPRSVTSAVSTILSAFHSIDVLVNNAGINIKAPAEDLTSEAWDEMIGVNLTAPFLLAQAVARAQIAIGEPLSIINISSTAATSALGRGTCGFGVSKAGLNELTRELAIEWATYGIRVNAIQPCQVTTPAFNALAQTDEGAQLIQRMIAGIPLGRFAEPAEIVGPVLFLASDASSMVTGAVLPVDGGNLAFNAGGTLRSVR